MKKASKFLDKTTAKGDASSDEEESDSEEENRPPPRNNGRARENKNLAPRVPKTFVVGDGTAIKGDAEYNFERPRLDKGVYHETDKKREEEEKDIFEETLGNLMARAKAAARKKVVRKKKVLEEEGDDRRPPRDCSRSSGSSLLSGVDLEGSDADRDYTDFVVSDSEDLSEHSDGSINETGCLYGDAAQVKEVRKQKKIRENDEERDERKRREREERERRRLRDPLREISDSPKGGQKRGRSRERKQTDRDGDGYKKKGKAKNDPRLPPHRRGHRAPPGGAAAAGRNQKNKRLCVDPTGVQRVLSGDSRRLIALHPQEENNLATSPFADLFTTALSESANQKRPPAAAAADAARRRARARGGRGGGGGGGGGGGWLWGEDIGPRRGRGGKREKAQSDDDEPMPQAGEGVMGDEIIGGSSSSLSPSSPRLRSEGEGGERDQTVMSLLERPLFFGGCSDPFPFISSEVFPESLNRLLDPLRSLLRPFVLPSTEGEGGVEGGTEGVLVLGRIGVENVLRSTLEKWTDIGLRTTEQRWEEDCREFALLLQRNERYLHSFVAEAAAAAGTMDERSQEEGRVGLEIVTRAVTEWWETPLARALSLDLLPHHAETARRRPSFPSGGETGRGGNSGPPSFRSFWVRLGLIWGGEDEGAAAPPPGEARVLWSVATAIAVLRSAERVMKNAERHAGPAASWKPIRIPVLLFTPLALGVFSLCGVIPTPQSSEEEEEESGRGEGGQGGRRENGGNNGGRRLRALRRFAFCCRQSPEVGSRRGRGAWGAFPQAAQEQEGASRLMLLALRLVLLVCPCPSGGITEIGDWGSSLVSSLTEVCDRVWMEAKKELKDKNALAKPAKEWRSFCSVFVPRLLLSAAVESGAIPFDGKNPYDLSALAVSSSVVSVLLRKCVKDFTVLHVTDLLESGGGGTSELVYVALERFYAFSHTVSWGVPCVNVRVLEEAMRPAASAPVRGRTGGGLDSSNKESELVKCGHVNLESLQQETQEWRRVWGETSVASLVESECLGERAEKWVVFWMAKGESALFAEILDVVALADSLGRVVVDLRGAAEGGGTGRGRAERVFQFVESRLSSTKEGGSFVDHTLFLFCLALACGRQDLPCSFVKSALDWSVFQENLENIVTDLCRQLEGGETSLSDSSYAPLLLSLLASLACICMGVSPPSFYKLTDKTKKWSDRLVQSSAESGGSTERGRKRKFGASLCKSFAFSLTLLGPRLMRNPNRRFEIGHLDLQSVLNLVLGKTSKGRRLFPLGCRQSEDGEEGETLPVVGVIEVLKQARRVSEQIRVGVEGFEKWMEDTVRGEVSPTILAELEKLFGWEQQWKVLKQLKSVRTTASFFRLDNFVSAFAIKGEESGEYIADRGELILETVRLCLPGQVLDNFSDTSLSRREIHSSLPFLIHSFTPSLRLTSFRGPTLLSLIRLKVHAEACLLKAPPPPEAREAAEHAKEAATKMEETLREFWRFIHYRPKELLRSCLDCALVCSPPLRRSDPFRTEGLQMDLLVGREVVEEVKLFLLGEDGQGRDGGAMVGFLAYLQEFERRAEGNEEATRAFRKVRMVARHLFACDILVSLPALAGVSMDPEIIDGICQIIEAFELGDDSVPVACCRQALSWVLGHDLDVIGDGSNAAYQDPVSLLWTAAVYVIVEVTKEASGWRGEWVCNFLNEREGDQAKLDYLFAVGCAATLLTDRNGLLTIDKPPSSSESSSSPPSSLGRLFGFLTHKYDEVIRNRQVPFSHLVVLTTLDGSPYGLSFPVQRARAHIHRVQELRRLDGEEEDSRKASSWSLALFQKVFRSKKGPRGKRLLFVQMALYIEKYWLSWPEGYLKEKLPFTVDGRVPPPPQKTIKAPHSWNDMAREEALCDSLLTATVGGGVEGNLYERASVCELFVSLRACLARCLWKIQAQTGGASSHVEYWISLLATSAEYCVVTAEKCGEDTATVTDLSRILRCLVLDFVFLCLDQADWKCGVQKVKDRLAGGRGGGGGQTDDPYGLLPLVLPLAKAFQANPIPPSSSSFPLLRFFLAFFRAVSLLSLKSGRLLNSGGAESGLPHAFGFRPSFHCLCRLVKPVSALFKQAFHHQHTAAAPTAQASDKQTKEPPPLTVQQKEKALNVLRALESVLSSMGKGEGGSQRGFIDVIRTDVLHKGPFPWGSESRVDVGALLGLLVKSSEYFLPDKSWEQVKEMRKWEGFLEHQMGGEEALSSSSSFPPLPKESLTGKELLEKVDDACKKTEDILKKLAATEGERGS
uniref:Uncharacterized protein n=1 Tax=Chromera velia CCMP2878 TaxID=1169474 RepID=A0A0G4GI60_9ALVE|eukprot:Cvel_21995.t1-p1 / transcript=Cvel_21995.t1 / gene=Cvel_21995 / organism=Chromera_velia_CCMP2878 / gene_product=hypothetical protein / transcript_product=hypothetical protein / location=Cvel_scaffold2119:11857-21447(-) / protein_length=2252 / sequence_SO=supercontig / SO=protein_coding / is_pseudo=false